MVVLGGLLEFGFGNTFSFVSFCGYGTTRTYSYNSRLTSKPSAWFLTYAATLQTYYNAAGAYAATPGATPGATEAAGRITPGYPASLGERCCVLSKCNANFLSGFSIVFVTVRTFIFLVYSLRVNVVFVLLYLVCSSASRSCRLPSSLKTRHLVYRVQELL